MFHHCMWIIIIATLCPSLANELIFRVKPTRYTHATICPRANMSIPIWPPCPCKSAIYMYVHVHAHKPCPDLSPCPLLMSCPPPLLSFLLHTHLPPFFPFSFWSHVSLEGEFVECDTFFGIRFYVYFLRQVQWGTVGNGLPTSFGPLKHLVVNSHGLNGSRCLRHFWWELDHDLVHWVHCSCNDHSHR